MLRPHKQQAAGDNGDEPLDDLTASQLKAKRSASIVAGIELLSIRGKRSPVVYLDIVALFRFSVAFDGEGYVNLQVGGTRSQGADGNGRHEGQGEEEAHAVGLNAIVYIKIQLGLYFDIER